MCPFASRRIKQAESITGWLFGKIGVSNASVIKDIEKLIDTYPRVSGGETYLSSERQKLSEKQMIKLQRCRINLSLPSISSWE